VGKKSYAAWAVQKGNKSVLEFFNAFLAEQKKNGTLKKLQAEHLKITFELPDVPLLPGDRPVN
jgi:polar amino acid transport system substrate-binding protein